MPDSKQWFITTSELTTASCPKTTTYPILGTSKTTDTYILSNTITQRPENTSIEPSKTSTKAILSECLKQNGTKLKDLFGVYTTQWLYCGQLKFE